MIIEITIIALIFVVMCCIITTANKLYENLEDIEIVNNLANMIEQKTITNLVVTDNAKCGALDIADKSITNGQYGITFDPNRTIVR